MPQSQSSISGAVRRSEGRSREGSLRIESWKEGAQGPAKSNNPADFGNDKIVLVQFEDGDPENPFQPTAAASPTAVSDDRRVDG
jgi:hypothetical protein